MSELLSPSGPGNNYISKDTDDREVVDFYSGEETASPEEVPESQEEAPDPMLYGAVRMDYDPEQWYQQWRRAYYRRSMSRAALWHTSQIVRDAST